MKNLMLAALALAALVVAVPVLAKEPREARICGPDACGVVSERSLLLSLFRSNGGGPTPPPGPYYRATVTLDVPNGPKLEFWYVPGAHALRSVDPNGPFADAGWMLLSPGLAQAFDGAINGVDPFSRVRVTAVRVGGRIVDDPASYLRLLTVESAPGLRVPDSSPWQDVFFAGRPSPWTGDGLGLQYSAGRNLLLRGDGIVRLPDELAIKVEAGRSLGSQGSGVPWAWLAAGVVALAVLASAALAAYHVSRRGPAPASEP